MNDYAETNVFRRKLTWRTLFVLLGGFVAVTGLLYAVSVLACRKLQQRRVESSLPGLGDGLRAQRERLVSAISAYHQDLGFYPPDHVLSQHPLAVDPVTNQLFYELLGCSYDSTNHSYRPRGSSVTLPAGLLHEFFGAERIRNSTEAPAQPRCFLDSAATEPLIAVHEKPQSIGLLTFWPNWEGFDYRVLNDVHIGTWQYNSSAATHNPKSYDLWIELKTPTTNLVIGNW